MGASSLARATALRRRSGFGLGAGRTPVIVAFPPRLAAVAISAFDLEPRRRSFGSHKYRRLLWKPQFPSDLPPALRQSAEVIRYAAPEVSPHKRTWSIYPSLRLRDIALRLCREGKVQELAANVIFHALTSVDSRCPREARRRERAFRSDLFQTCSNLFEVHHVHEGAENIFGVLNQQTMLEVSPKIKPTRRLHLRRMVTATFEDFVSSHQDGFSRVDATQLFDVVGPKEFYRLIPLLNLNLHALRGEDVEVLFYHIVNEAKDIFGAMRVSLSLLPVSSIEETLGGSSWSLRRILGLIEQRRSEHALRFLISHLYPASLVSELLAALRDRDFDTGLVRNEWAYFASKHIEHDMHKGLDIFPPAPDFWSLPSVDDEEASVDWNPLAAVDEDGLVPHQQRIWLTDGELRPFSIEQRLPNSLGSLAPPSRLRDTAWPQLAFDPDAAIASDRGRAAIGDDTASSGMNAYDALREGVDGVDALTLWGSSGESVFASPSHPSSTPSALGPQDLPQPDQTLPLESIHLVDSVQGLSHVLTFLQTSSPAFVGIDLEWTEPHPVSLMQIATPHRAFVIDTVQRTDLYMSVLHALVDWLLKREETTKLFYGFPNDLVRLNFLFERMGRSFGAGDHLASILDLHAQRVRRVVAPAARVEDTPLGRESLLGGALETQDFEEVQRIGRTPAPHPPREELTERVFLLGGTYSLSEMASRFLGERLDKSLRKSNWNFRPLSASQVIYAATDAHVLLRLEAAMRERGVLPQRIFGVAPRSRPQAAWWRLDEPDEDSPTSEDYSEG
eukprot:TRINITY_DN72655_c0_g1_i1.p1 TRINITY_DN72655_c0_g1~~TRINITY_DN72655_c0_g1_i1.p1  ORF type:complete len:800 (-),score=82.92 TRINITY_DN72655_c0_g1_i1:206-2572(-)